MSDDATTDTPESAQNSPEEPASPPIADRPANYAYAEFASAMADLRAVGKDETNQNQGFKFRGIDGVMNAVGPVFRRHGLFIIPAVTDHTMQQVTGRNGRPMNVVTVTVSYTIAHSSGDTFTGIAVGEANDSADKATAKAMSVALRTFLLQSLVLPTQDSDPDHDYLERGTRADRPADVSPRVIDAPDFNVETATRPQLMQAMREARAGNNRDLYEQIREAGNRRFPTPNSPAAGQNQEQ